MCVPVVPMTGCSPEALEVLSDLLGSFLSNFAKFLKMNTDHTPGGHDGCRGFHDALERSLHQVGMEGKKGLWQYWQQSVLSRSRQLEMEADEYKNAYLRLTVCYIGIVYDSVAY